MSFAPFVARTRGQFQVQRWVSKTDAIILRSRPRSGGGANGFEDAYCRKGVNLGATFSRTKREISAMSCLVNSRGTGEGLSLSIGSPNVRVGVFPSSFTLSLAERGQLSSKP